MVDRQCRHGGNGQQFLVEIKDMSINVCVNSAYFSSDNLYVRKCHLKVSVSFFYMNLWTSVNVKKFLLCFTWNSHLQKNSQWCDECQCVDSAERCIGSPPAPPPLPHPFFFHPPPFFRNMHSPSWHPSRENTIFYHDTLESGRLKTINIKPWKPITCRNCVSWYI